MKSKKDEQDQKFSRREPRQERALQKVGLMLEAATRLIEANGIESLTTNAIAERAGVSIGTLYQYFDNKQAILDALTHREMATMGERVKRTLASPPPSHRGERVPLLMQAILDSYGGRRKAHRRLMEHAMARGAGGRLNPLFAQVAETLAREGIITEGNEKLAMTAAEAFVLTHAVTGVMRGLLTNHDAAPSRDEVGAALTRLVLGFVGASTGSGRTGVRS